MAHLEMTDADKTALGWYNQNIQGRYCQRCGAAGPPAAGGWISANRCFMYADGYGRMDLARAEHAVLAGGRGAGTVLGLCGLHSPVRPRYRAAAPDGGGKRCSAERGVPRAVPPSAWNWSTKQPEGQASEEFNGQAGFSETGGFWNGRWPPAQVAAKRPCRPAPYEGTPAFRTLGRTGMKITIVRGHAHQRTRDLPGGL